MKEREPLEEQLEELYFTDLMDGVACQTQQQLEDWVRWAEQEDALRVPTEVDRRCQAQIRRAFSGAGRRRGTRALKHILRTVLAATLLVSALFTTAFALSEEFRLTAFRLTVPAAVLQPDETGAEAASQTLLSKAFAFDGSHCSPLIIQGDLMSYRYVPDPAQPLDFYLVDFKTEYPYPMTLYHFCHPNQEGLRLEEEEDAFLPAEMAETARSFVEHVYGVDASQAALHAYGYQNKFSVQLEVAEDVIFQVRFAHQDPAPVGVLYFPDAAMAAQAMKAAGAVPLPVGGAAPSP